jgi:hypothetical protein
MPAYTSASLPGISLPSTRASPVVDQRAKRVDQFEPHARETFRERNDFHEHDQPHDVVVQILANSYRVRANKILLQAHELVVTDTNTCQLPESRIDAVDFLACGDDVADVLARFCDRPLRIEPKRHLDGFAPGLAQLAEGDELFVDRQFHDESPVSIIGRFRPFSRAQSIASS